MTSLDCFIRKKLTLKLKSESEHYNLTRLFTGYSAYGSCLDYTEYAHLLSIELITFIRYRSSIALRGHKAKTPKNLYACTYVHIHTLLLKCDLYFMK